VLVLFFCTTASAIADTYTVSRNDDPNPDACLPGDCSLREAVIASNSTPAVDDSIVIPASSSPYQVLYEELTLPVNDESWIRGEGANRTVVEGDGKAVLFTVKSGRSARRGPSARGCVR
jgi:CSLREA domain-containing protein